MIENGGMSDILSMNWTDLMIECFRSSTLTQPSTLTRRFILTTVFFHLIWSFTLVLTRNHDLFYCAGRSLPINICTFEIK